MFNLIVCALCAFAAGLSVGSKDYGILFFANIAFTIANGLIVYGDMIK